MRFASAGYARVAIHARYILLRSDVTRVSRVWRRLQRIDLRSVSEHLSCAILHLSRLDC